MTPARVDVAVASSAVTVAVTMSQDAHNSEIAQDTQTSDDGHHFSIDDGLIVRTFGNGHDAVDIL